MKHLDVSGLISWEDNDDITLDHFLLTLENNNMCFNGSTCLVDDDGRYYGYDGKENTTGISYEKLKSIYHELEEHDLLTESMLDAFQDLFSEFKKTISNQENEHLSDNEIHELTMSYLEKEDHKNTEWVEPVLIPDNDEIQYYENIDLGDIDNDHEFYFLNDTGSSAYIHYATSSDDRIKIQGYYQDNQDGPYIPNLSTCTFTYPSGYIPMLKTWIIDGSLAIHLMLLDKEKENKMKQTKEVLIDYFSELPNTDLFASGDPDVLHSKILEAKYYFDPKSVQKIITDAISEIDGIEHIGTIITKNFTDVYLNSESIPMLNFTIHFIELDLELDVESVFNHSWNYYIKSYKDLSDSCE
ncbi:hypothetical protein KLEB273_gp203 [Bacillus phage vB_BauM_KLEB27-3]|nr:hypothetical protein KLEB273_gp203 [Bacillus phage vB_BauM_KLEB27-3]